MSIDDIIDQLESLKDNSQSFIEDDEPESIWVQDIEALDEAIKIIKDKTKSPRNMKKFRFRARMILEYYGAETRKRQCIEEMAELTKAINKEWRFNRKEIKGKPEDFKNNIIEEMADVAICLEQLLVLYDCEDKFYNTVEKKINRTIERIETAEVMKSECEKVFAEN